MKTLCVAVLAVLVVSLSGCVEPKQEKAAVIIKDGSQVSFDYTLTVDGKVVDTSEGKQPLQYVQGQGKMIPGLTRQLEGLKQGDEKDITISPREAYGEINPDAFREVPRDQMPQDMTPEVGMVVQISNNQGQSAPVRISQVKEDSVTIDLNHPLAGKTLDFHVKIVSVEKPQI